MDGRGGSVAELIVESFIQRMISEYQRDDERQSWDQQTVLELVAYVPPIGGLNRLAVATNQWDDVLGSSSIHKDKLSFVNCM